MKIILSLGLLICTISCSFGQRFSFITFSNSQGLPQSQVQCITQDDNGFLWVGTLGGLAKFNGKSFTTFSIDQGLYNNRVSVVQHIQGTIWVGHVGGVTSIKNNKAHAYAFSDEDLNILVTDIVAFKNKIVISTEGSGIYYISDGKIRKVSLKNEDASTCRDLQIIDDELYIGTRDGIYHTSDLTNFKKIPTFGSQSVASIAVNNREVYVATFYRGLFHTSTAFKSFDSIPIPVEDNYIGSIKFDNKNQLWLIKSEEILCLKNNQILFSISEKSGLPINAINCIFQDKEGSIWFGSEGKGLIRFANQELVYYSTITGLPSDLILTGKKVTPSTYYFGSYDKGAFSMKLDGTSKALPIPASTIWDIEVFEGKTWFATDMGLFSLDHQGKVSNFNFKDFPNTIRVLKVVKNKLVVAGEEQLGYVSNDQLIPFQNIHFNITSEGNIRDLVIYNSKLLLATSKAIYQISDNYKRVQKIKPFRMGISTIEVDHLNNLWVGTENGLFRFDGIVWENQNISAKSGGKFINFIQNSDELLFVGTNDGLYILQSTEEKGTEILKHFGTNNGLINLELNLNSSFLDEKFFWFGTSDGLARLTYQTQKSIFKEFPPKLSIQNILVNFSELDNYSKVTGLNLNYNRNNLIINLDGISLEDPESILYQYWLEGETDSWSPVSSNPSVILNNLGDGNYTLHIRAISGTKKFSNVISLPIRIKPPFWRTWWFYILVFIAIAFSIRYYFRLQIKRERDKNYKINLENKSRLLALEQQSLNASMNRHFIFNSLNSIQYFINTQDKLSANRYLTSFAKLIRKNLDSAAEGDNMVTLHQEIERLELYLSLESMRFKDRFTYKIDEGNVDTEQVLVPAMLLQPFVENSIIHGILPDESKEGRIEITIKVIGTQLEVCIDDNGIGIEFSRKKKAQFQGDHKSQGMEITSKRIDLIREMWNKEYELIGPFQMMNPDSSIKGTRVLIKIPYENLENQN